MSALDFRKLYEERSWSLARPGHRFESMTEVPHQEISAKPTSAGQFAKYSSAWSTHSPSR